MTNHILTGAQWSTKWSDAKRRWVKEHLGERPTRQSIKASSNLKVRTNLLEKAAILVLVVIATFTSFKMAAVAVPYAESVLEHLSHTTEISPWVNTAFTVVTMVLFALLATPALIYFQLLAQEREIRKQIDETANYPFLKRFSLSWITPRIPAVGVYLVTAWLVYVGWAGEGSFFDKYVVVWFEIGLAHLVGTIIERNRQYEELIDEAYEGAVQPWDAKLENYRKQPTFLETLYTVLRDSFAQDKTRSVEEIDKLVLENYRAHTMSRKFVQMVIEAGGSVEDETEDDGFPVPPSGSVWTPEALFNHLKLNWKEGVDPNRLSIIKEYGKKSRASFAWRDGAQALWLSHKSQKN